MKTIQAAPSIPRYVLLNEDESPDGPRCRDHAGEPCTAVYGFSDRSSYEAFSAGVTELRRPYPLVGGDLKRMLQRSGVQLVVINAAGPTETNLVAATADAVLLAQTNPSEPVSTSYRLSLATGTAEYDVERLSRSNQE